MTDKKRILGYCMLLSLFLFSCASVDKFNAQIDKPRSVHDLKQDVDYIQHKLETLHPDLYHYISKKDLDYKFDSLRASINTPLTSNDFYFRLSPVITSIRQGHTQTFPLTKKLKPSEKKMVNAKGKTPLSLFDFELFDHKLYIVNNYSKDSTIHAGTEVLTVNGLKPADIIDKYGPTFTSDGYNATFIPRLLGKGFPRLFFYQNGITDSVSFVLNYKDSIRAVCIKNTEKVKMPVVKTPVVKKTKMQKSIERAESIKRQIQGYDPLKRLYSKQLIFPVKDSSIAVMKILDFMKGNHRSFYNLSFKELNAKHTKVLILDLRDNTGGRLSDINYLYSYLADSSFHLINKSEVVSKTSLWYFGYFNDKPLWTQALQVVFLPFVVVADAYTFISSVKGKDHKYRFALREARLTKPKSNGFKGKVYVLINGGSFSASSILSSNLKESKRATFVGDETGGADNGCVAGFMPVSTLPNSKLTVRFGLLVCQTPFKSEKDGRGIFPDVEITPSLKDRINGTDPELEWVLNDAKGLH